MAQLNRRDAFPLELLDPPGKKPFSAKIEENRVSAKTKVIPPLTPVKLISDAPNWSDQKGTVFRVGYYRTQDGLDCVWLVDDAGEYCQTTAQHSIMNDFAILELSLEHDLYGIDREIIGFEKTIENSLLINIFSLWP